MERADYREVHICSRFGQIWIFAKRAVCNFWFTKMNSFCQCAPSLPLSLRLLEWMGSCIQGPSSCNEQDGVQSLLHHRFFSDWERQLPSSGWIQSWQLRFLWFLLSVKMRRLYLCWKRFVSCKTAAQIMGICAPYRTTWWGRGVVHPDYEPQYHEEWHL